MRQRFCRGFTLIELIVVVALIAVLSALVAPTIWKARQRTSTAVAAHTLEQLAMAAAIYLPENNNVYWKYSDAVTYGPDTLWWFGLESVASKGQAEGQRYLDKSKGPLGPYIVDASGLVTDPWFYGSGQTFKPKFNNSHFAFGFNGLLEGRNASSIQQPGQCVVFATCAQVNTFQRPASAKNPMVEEFYLINDREYSVHFRVGGQAMVAFANGSVGFLEPDPKTMDPRIKSAQIGRFAPVGSKKYLE